MSGRVSAQTARLLSALLTLAALFGGLSAAPAGATVVRQHGRLFGFDGYHGAGAGRVRPSVRAAADGGSGFGYQGGPVLHSSAPYLVFWDPTGAIPASSRALAVRFFADVAKDSGRPTNRYAVDRQYADATGFADYRQSFDPAAQTILDADPYPSPSGCSATTAALTTCLSDDDVAGELDRLISAQGLPTGTGAQAPVYFVFLPSYVNECSSSSSCATNTFCAYHTYLTTDSGQTALYAVLPSVSVSAGEDAKDCQWDGGGTVQEPNQDPMDVILSSVSHEDSETITDPLLNAWIDPASGNETSDMCSQQGADNPIGDSNPQAFLPTQGGSSALGTLFDQTIAGDRFYLQSEWSNGGGDCEQAPARQTLSPAFRTAPAGGGTALRLDPAAGTSTGGYSSLTWNFGDGSAPLFTRASTPAAVTHAFPHAGSYTVTLTVVDAYGNLATTRQAVVLGAAPAPAISLSARPAAGSAAHFSAAASHALSSGTSLTAYRWSFGDGATAGGAATAHVYAAPGTYTVTLQVTDSLGQSATATRTVTVSAARRAKAAGLLASAASVRGKAHKHKARKRRAAKRKRAHKHARKHRHTKHHRAAKRPRRARRR